ALVRAERLAEAAARPVLEAVRERMRAIGCRLIEGEAAAALARLGPEPIPSVRIETLGGFRVVRSGQVVANSVWKSRKARDLLKILISRRGRPVAHEQLIEMLWPEESPAAVANRFHVVVSTVRSLLDPGRRLNADGFVINEGNAFRLELAPLEIDCESFLADATAGLRLVRDGREADGIERLLRAESSYAGDFLEEDLYQDWAAALREEARITYREVTGTLARLAQEVGDTDAAVRYLLRSLERDVYDESTHLELVSVLAGCGRHGDARMHYRSYCERMDELGVEAAPFPAARRRGISPR
ncbi:MAG: AfsR/SARP family transcriptional regulator, partial [Haloechinothrix sp.]